MKLNWFSPLPPAQSEIAYYTARLAPVLAAHAQITFWTDCDVWDVELEKYGDVRFYRPEQFDWAELNRGDMSIYHIGNSARFHKAIWQMSRRHPGVVVLHDTRLHHLFVELFWDQTDDPVQYFAQMELYYGATGLREAKEFFMGAAHDFHYMAKRYPLVTLAVDDALGVIVHTEEGFDNLKRADRCPVAYAPLPFDAITDIRESESSPPAASEVSDARYRLIVFGHIGDNRRLDAVFDALADLPARDQFRLDVYGRVSNEDSLRVKVYALGIEDSVILHGFVANEELDAALSTAHLAINLRYPSMGEASASQLRIWSYALPSLVTQVDWYATLPADAVAFVRPRHEVEDIQMHLNAFLHDPALFLKMGERGRQTLTEHHAPETYIQSLMKLTSIARNYRSRAMLYKLAERTGREMNKWMTPAAFDEAREKVAGEIAAL